MANEFANNPTVKLDKADIVNLQKMIEANDKLGDLVRGQIMEVLVDASNAQEPAKE